MFVKLYFAAAIAALVNSTPFPMKHVIHEERTILSRDWNKGARLAKSDTIPMRIGLAQTNLEKGYDYLMEVSHPDSEKYGKHWTADEVHEMFAPEETAVANIMEWLISFGIDESRIVHSDNKGWIAVDVTVEEGEALLLTEFYEHEHKRSSNIRIGTDKYHVPENIQTYVDYITPGIKLTSLVKRTFNTGRRTSNAVKAPIHVKVNQHSQVATAEEASLSSALQDCKTLMTPQCIKALYGIPNATLSTPGHSLGLYQQGSYFAKSDLDAYYKLYAPHVPQGTYPINATIDGASYSVEADSDLNSGEATIDIEVATSMIYPQTVTLYQVDDDIYGPQEIESANLFNTFLDALDGSYCNYTSDGETGNNPDIDPIYPNPAEGGYKGTLQCGVYTPTKVISASYGQSAADLPAPYSRRQCNEFMKLGLQGHSILIASGDYGVASYPGDRSASGCMGPKEIIFNADYPSGCPYVTSVGGTQLAHNGTVFDPEVALRQDFGGVRSNFSSSGGFSNYFKRPSYQDGHIEMFFYRANLTYPYYSELNVDVNTTSGIYNRIGRGYPDVSATAALYPAVLHGNASHFSGTSLSSPLFASVITLLNEERAAVGKSPIGFINPVLYRHDNVLNDITEGNNLGCGSQGFPAVKGWDPVTGLGTPNYPKMRNLFLSLP